MKFVFSVIITWLMQFVFPVVRFFYRGVTLATCLRSFSSSSRKKPSTTWTPTRKAAEELNSRAAMGAVIARSLPLTEQQAQVLEAIAVGESVFITGSAGTGKTILLKHVIDMLTHIHGSKHVFVTASTGVAACALNGMTLHSFAGIGLGTGDQETLLLTAASKKSISRRWRRAKALVIDEGIRRGLNDREHLQLLNTRLVESEPGPLVIRLFPRKQDVQRVNDKRLRSLGGDIYTYTALDIGQDPWKRQLKLGVAPDELELCLEARVMLLKNLDPKCGLVNGATGTVVGFQKPKEVMVTDISDSGLLPIVEFDSGLEMVIHPDRWEVKEGETVFATRMQLPLILAWALSIHKCQGMTLDCLHTDLSRAFGCGMVYVALSRVRSLDGLHLSGFSPSKIKAHPKVLEFYQNLFGFRGRRRRKQHQGFLQAVSASSLDHFLNWQVGNMNQGFSPPFPPLGFSSFHVPSVMEKCTSI
ncbi:hypothetical protein NE237_026975 [Protea cynaroides]|uniref:ATP-dependent DNA helicase n=1 Tax=Protea cynaroides TaxID=273540 RepID=A0A9Q0GM22_9MAGN|nr:hypothetical protein NE237_026975 [Protea cynaroides]